MKGWTHVFRKELREFARDKRVLYTALIGPVFLEILMIFLFGFLHEAFSEKKTQKISVINAAEGKPVLDFLRKKQVFEITEIPLSTNVDELLKKGKTRLVLQFPDGFATKYAARQAPTFEAIFDPNETTSEVAKEKVKGALMGYREEQRLARMKERNLDPKSFETFDLKEKAANTGKAFAGTFLVGFLPYLIVIWAFYGGFSIVSDLVAGEKERGSLETLLVSPLSRTSIAFGKFASLALLSLTSCSSALIGVIIMATINPPITQKLFESGLSMSALSIFAIAMTLLPLIIFFAGTLLAISTFAKNQREVQGYLSMASFVVLMPAIMSQFIGFTEAATARWVPLVPVLNTATVIRQALLEKVDWYSLITAASVNTALAAFAIWFAIRLFSKESVLLRT